MGKNAAAESAHTSMSTQMTHKVFGKHAEQALRAVAVEAERLENMLSRFRPGSEIHRVNKSAGLKCEKLSEDTYEVLSRAAQFSGICKGLFDVTIGPLVDLWDYKNAHMIPSDARIKLLLPLVNHTELLLDPNEQTAGLQKAKQSIDLGGIGKGFASDRFLEIFRKYGIASAYTNIGGNVATLGHKPDGSPWRVGIRHPRQENSLIGALSVADKAVVTSGDYQRFFIDNSGIRRHHILDPATGYPSESGLISVTVVADSGMTADAMSTILFIAGMEKGLRLLSGIPQTEAVFVDADLRVYVTQGLKESFQSADGITANIVE